MTGREIRVRLIEAVTGSGIKEVSKILREAKELEEWVLLADNGDEPPARRGRPPKAEDKA